MFILPNWETFQIQLKLYITIAVHASGSRSCLLGFLLKCNLWKYKLCYKELHPPSYLSIHQRVGRVVHLSVGVLADAVGLSHVGWDPVLNSFPRRPANLIRRHETLRRGQTRSDTQTDEVAFGRVWVRISGLLRTIREALDPECLA